MLGESQLRLKDLEGIVWGGEPLELAESAREAVDSAAEYVREQARSGRAVYGVTTGFGANRDRVIKPDDAEKLQENLIMSHACGVGEPLPTEAVRTMMVLRVAALIRGRSGIRWSTLKLLADMVNARVHPVVPRMGSVGASGDLCPLAHMCLPIIGMGQAEYQNETLDGGEAMRRAGLEPVSLTYKEGLALLNGTQAMTALGVVACHRFRRLVDAADAIGAMSLEAVAGRLDALDPRIHELRGRTGQRVSASNVLRLLDGSELADAQPGTIVGKVEYVQDSYCLRCMPQVHGASRDVLSHVEDVLQVEANAVTDNPLVFAPGVDGVAGILSGGNFHGQPVAFALDYLKLAIAEIGSVSERRSAKLTDKYFSEGLPPFLVSEPGLNSGMMIPQYVAAALVSENKNRASPASVDSIPTSANMEDHVSMGMHAGLHALEILKNTERILGIEYLIAAQAFDLRGEIRFGTGTRAAYDLIREHVSFMECDRVLNVDINASSALVSSGELAAVVQSFCEDSG